MTCLRCWRKVNGKAPDEAEIAFQVITGRTNWVSDRECGSVMHGAKLQIWSS